jgi:hypothetical protein
MSESAADQRAKYPLAAYNFRVTVGESAMSFTEVSGSKNAPPQDCSEIKEDNLKKVLVTKAGTKILFTDAKKASLSFETASKNKILLDDDKELIEISDKHGNKIILDKNGITLDTGKDLKLTAKGNVEIQGGCEMIARTYSGARQPT